MVRICAAAAANDLCLFGDPEEQTGHCLRRHRIDELTILQRGLAAVRLNHQRQVRTGGQPEPDCLQIALRLALYHSLAAREESSLGYIRDKFFTDRQ